MLVIDRIDSVYARIGDLTAADRIPRTSSVTRPRAGYALHGTRPSRRPDALSGMASSLR
jgi:hypothetical protein